MIFKHNDYRTYLSSVLDDRQTRNPSYSMRSMAKSLGLNPTSLLQIMRRQKNLSQDRAHEIAKRLGLSRKETEYFDLLVQHATSKSEEKRRELENKILLCQDSAPVIKIPAAKFDLVSSWYTVAILQLTELKGFDFSAPNVATLLGISEQQVSDAIQKLLNANLLIKSDDGTWKKAASRMITSSTHSPKESFQKFHSKMLEKARESIPEQDPNSRILESLTYTFDPKLIDQVRALTNEYLSQLTNLIDSGEDDTELYQMNLQFFNLTREKTI